MATLSVTRVKAYRLKRSTACEMLAVSERTLERLIAAGVLTDARPLADRKRGKSGFVWADEVDVLMAPGGGEAACRDFRLAKGRA